MGISLYSPVSTNVKNFFGHAMLMDKEKKLALVELGSKIKEIRQSKKPPLSAYRLSLMLEKSSTYMRKVEAGEVNISYFALIEICECLDIDPKTLF